MSWNILDSCCLKCRSLSLCFRRGSAKIIAGNVGHEVLSFLLPSPFLILHSCPGPFSKFHLPRWVLFPFLLKPLLHQENDLSHNP